MGGDRQPGWSSLRPSSPRGGRPGCCRFPFLRGRSRPLRWPWGSCAISSRGFPPGRPSSGGLWQRFSSSPRPSSASLRAGEGSWPAPSWYPCGFSPRPTGLSLPGGLPSEWTDPPERKAGIERPWFPSCCSPRCSSRLRGTIRLCPARRRWPWRAGPFWRYSSPGLVPRVLRQRAWRHVALWEPWLCCPSLPFSLVFSCWGRRRRPP